jgi:glycosyltransferase involved in cell wall biosynthesis
MKISVIIPCYNYSQFVTEAVCSVYNQTYKNIECIVVNDGSTDNSLMVLNKLKSDKYSDLLIIDKENGGLSSARNAGLKKSSGDLIAFLDADDLWLSSKISNQVQIFETTNADIVFSDYKLLEQGKMIDHNEEEVSQELGIINFIEKNPCRSSASGIIIKRHVFEKVGYFDLNLRSLEDLDYWFRCSLMGFKFKYCNQKDVILRSHNDSMMSNHLKMYFYHYLLLENQLTLIKKINLPKKELIKAVRSRLGIIRWYAYQLKRPDLCINTYLFGIMHWGIFFFNPFLVKMFIKDIIFLIKSKKK